MPTRMETASNQDSDSESEVIVSVYDIQQPVRGYALFLSIKVLKPPLKRRGQHRGVEQLVARVAHNHEVEGSNPSHRNQSSQSIGL